MTAPANPVVPSSHQSDGAFPHPVRYGATAANSTLKRGPIFFSCFFSRLSRLRPPFCAIELALSDLCTCHHFLSAWHLVAGGPGVFVLFYLLSSYFNTTLWVRTEEKVKARFFPVPRSPSSAVIQQRAGKFDSVLGKRRETTTVHEVRPAATLLSPFCRTLPASSLCPIGPVIPSC